MDLSKFSLNSKNAIVTGGNGGIGLSMATGLTKAGANLAIWGRNPEKNQAAVAELSQYGTTVIAVQMDASDESSTRAAMEETVAAFGSINIAVANAGVTGEGSFPTQFPKEEWERVMDVNVTGVFLTLREISNHMIEQGTGGSLIVTGSMGGVIGMPRSAHYGASKAAVLHMVKSLAITLAKHKIRVNAIAPGFIRTDMSGGLQGNEAFERAIIGGRTPMRRWGTPEEFEGPTVFLASDASSFMTGSTVTVDGGFLAS